MKKRAFVIRMNEAIKEIELNSCHSCTEVNDEVGSKARREYEKFLKKCFSNFSCADSLADYVYNSYEGTLNYDEFNHCKMTTTKFLRLLVLMQFKAHCLETKLYEKF